MNKKINKVIFFTSGLLIASPMIGANTFNYSSDGPVLNQLKAIPFENPSDQKILGADGVMSSAISNGKLFTFIKQTQDPVNKINLYITPINGVGMIKKLTIVVNDPSSPHAVNVLLQTIIISKDGQHFIAVTNTFGYIVGDTTTAEQTLNVTHIYSGDHTNDNLKLITRLKTDGTNIYAAITGRVNNTTGATQYGSYIFSFPIADCFTNKETLDNNFADASFTTTKKIFIATASSPSDFLESVDFQILDNKAYIHMIGDSDARTLWMANLADAKADISTHGKAIAKKIDISSLISDKFFPNSVYINDNKVLLSSYDTSGVELSASKSKTAKIYDITSGSLTPYSDSLSGTLIDPSGKNIDSFRELQVSSEVTVNGYTLISGNYVDINSEKKSSTSSIPILRTPKGKFIMQKYFNSPSVHLDDDSLSSSAPTLPRIYTDENPAKSTSNIVSLGRLATPDKIDNVYFYKFNSNTWSPDGPVPDKSGSSSGLSTGAIVGIVIGSIAGAALIGTGIYFLGKNQGWWKAQALTPKASKK